MPTGCIEGRDLDCRAPPGPLITCGGVATPYSFFRIWSCSGLEKHRMLEASRRWLHRSTTARRDATEEKKKLFFLMLQASSMLLKPCSRCQASPPRCKRKKKKFFFSHVLSLVWRAMLSQRVLGTAVAKSIASDEDACLVSRDAYLKTFVFAGQDACRRDARCAMRDALGWAHPSSVAVLLHPYSVAMLWCIPATRHPGIPATRQPDNPVTRQPGNPFDFHCHHLKTI